MKIWKIAALIAALSFSYISAALAQSGPGGVVFIPPITPGDCAKWLAANILEDAGACGTGAGGFPITLGSTSIAGGSTTTSVTGLSIAAGGGNTLAATTLTLAGNALQTAPASAQLQFGAADVAGAPVAQTLSVQSAASVSNQAGANTTIDLSAGTGTGVGGNLVINGAPHSTTGTTKNAYSSALTINGDTLNANFGGAVIAAGNVQPSASSFVIWNGRSKMQSPADAEFEIQNNAGSTTLMDIGVTTASTITLPLATTISNATVKMTALATAAGTSIVCSGTGGLLTIELIATTCSGSAERFKRDINYLDPTKMLTEVLGMKPISFRYKDGEEDGGVDSAGNPIVHYGLKAEDLIPVAPELVAYQADGQTAGVKYGAGELQSHLIGAIKAEQAEIVALKNKSGNLSSEFCIGDLCVGWK